MLDTTTTTLTMTPAWRDHQRYALLAYGTTSRRRSNVGYEIHVRRRDKYVEGKSPLKIAAGLIPSPAKGTKGKTSGHGKQNTINGNRELGTGILNNELYIGRRVWNRLTYTKNPATEKRVSKLNPESEWQIAEVPHLRIVDQDLWDEVRHGRRRRRSASPGWRRPTAIGCPPSRRSVDGSIYYLGCCIAASAGAG